MFYIYRITNKINGKFYIGQTANPKRRWNEHIAVTKAGKEKSKNKYLVINAAIAKHGINNFTFEIIDQTEQESLIDNLEICWIGQFKDSGLELYNADSGGKVLRGINHHMYGKKHSNKTKKLIGETSKGRECFWKGKHLSKKTTDKISDTRKTNKVAAGEKNPAAKLTLVRVEEIRSLTPIMKYKDIAAKYNVSKSTIQRIKAGTHWK